MSESGGVPDADQERVRRLLADLAAAEHRDPSPVPPDVAARLERALAAEGTDRPSAVTSLRATRRRRAPLLAAAAAVVLVGGGGALALSQGGGGDDSFAGGASSQASETVSPSPESDTSTGEDSGGASPTDPSGPGEMSAPGDDGDSQDEGRMVPAPAVSRADLATDVSTLIARGEVAAPGVAGAAAAAPERQRVEDSGCAVPAPVRGAATLVMIEGDPAVLVVGGPVGDELPVELLTCADGAVVEQAQVPAG